MRLTFSQECEFCKQKLCDVIVHQGDESAVEEIIALTEPLLRQENDSPTFALTGKISLFELPEAA